MTHAGKPVALNVSSSPSASAATGWKEYDEPDVALAKGAPEIVGAWLEGSWEDVPAGGATETCTSSSAPQAASSKHVARVSTPVRQTIFDITYSTPIRTATGTRCNVEPRRDRTDDCIAAPAAPLSVGRTSPCRPEALRPRFAAGLPLLRRSLVNE